MARKKIVLVIVEGASDETALGIVLSQMFDKDSVYVHIMHGDITSKAGVTAKNIVAKVGEEVKAYAKSNHFTAKHFRQIIHITDTDAAYLAEDKVIDDSQCEEWSYQDDGIHTSEIGKAIARNKQKSENMNRLRACGAIWGIPYSIYYMSCNLDHVLHNKRNSTDEEKEQDAYSFAKRYKKDMEAFLKFMCHSLFSIKGDYKESWEFIEKDMHSIERHTNFPICLEQELLAQKSNQMQEEK